MHGSEAWMRERMGDGIAIAVDGVEMSGSVETLGNGMRMSAAAEGSVHIYAAGMNLQCFEAFLEQCRSMVCVLSHS